ncbi:MAG: hypothetical protein KJ914_09510 [Gammaproteobacteria bacterium]|nr:hypothetical protein [Gammaproteobacteria bacterium]MBU1723456.1 hypothetical protein [Gammaproteobacteria bacterium]MBU2004422.1 hypothetical protein [Gammaproteobacteria bacterium]
MLWRLVLVVWSLALLIGLAFYFSDEIFAITQHVLTLDKDGRERIIQLEEMLAKGLGVVGTLLGFVAAIWTFMQSKKAEKAIAGNATNTFHHVETKGDFVMGNKSVNGGKDAG